MKQIVIRQSLIKQFLDNGTEIPHCPAAIYRKYFLNENEPATIPQQIGSWFEYFILGATSEEDPVTEYPKQGRGKSPSVSYTRLVKQAGIFHQLAEQRGIIINENTRQRLIRAPWPQSEACCPKCEGNNIKFSHNLTPSHPIPYMGHCLSCNFISEAADFALIVLAGRLDLLSPMMKGDKYLPLVDIDIKTCADVTSDFGKYQWADPENRDHTQVKFYDYIFFINTGSHISHCYIVFDYSPKMGSKIVWKTITDIDQAEIKEAIRKTVNLISHYNEIGWGVNPEYDVCKNCHLECNSHNNTKPVFDE